MPNVWAAGQTLLTSKGAHVMKTAVIGLGNFGSTLAASLAAGVETVIVSRPHMAQARELASKLGGSVEALPIEEAIANADIIVLAIWFNVMNEFVTKNRNALVGKTVIDPSNPIAPNGKGGFDKTIPADQSAGEIIAGLLPPGAEPVKAFCSMGADSLSSGANRKPERAVLFYATDFPEAGRAVSRLIRATGFAPMSAGGIDKSIRIEAFGDLNQFTLGKLVSVKEAEALV
jgi:predicted dinucleotide-binding enzyme